MTILIFIIVLSILIIVHELGHLFVAKKFGIRVDEFGLGYPPRAKKLFSWKGTLFSLNWLPFGGFVRIFGENGSEEEPELSPPSNSFVAKSKGIQISVLIAGVVGNLFLAWIFIAMSLSLGMSAPTTLDLPVQNAKTVVMAVLPNSPADKAGLKSGDVIVGLERAGEVGSLEAGAVADFISSSKIPIKLAFEREGTKFEASIIPVENIVPNKLAIGVSMDSIGTVKLSPLPALWHGFIITGQITFLTADALLNFFLDAFGGHADLSTMTGPIGLVGLVGEASNLGLAYLLSFTALISINLAIINLLPFPALDGGRILFVLIEAISRRTIPAKVTNIINTIGFALLILLMVLISIQDIRNIF